jgi:DNA polymerase III subunit epsilon
MGHLSPESFVPVQFDSAVDGTNEIGKPKRQEGNPGANPEHPFFGKVLAFTGGMYSMLRREAAQRVVVAGGTFVTSMNKQVDFLTIGDADFVGFQDGARTGKIAKLIELRDTGKCHAEVLSERDFLALLRSET